MRIIFLLLISSSIFGQDSTKILPRLFSKQNKAVYGTVMIAGVLSGINESLWAYNPFAGSEFSDPYISWKRQYRDHLQINGKSFRGKYLTATTDLNHATAAGRDVAFTVSAVISWEDIKGFKTLKTKYVLEKLGLCWLSRTIGHNGSTAIMKAL